VNLQEYLEDILSRLKFSTYAEADRYLKLHYETVFKIHDHNKDFQTTGKASVTLRHSGMGAGDYEVIDKLLPAYTDNFIREVTDMSFERYIMLPRPMMHAFNRRCKIIHVERLKKEDEAKAKAEEQLRLLMGGKLPTGDHPRTPM